MVLQPTAGLDRAWASDYIARGFSMRKEDADRWVTAFTLFYQEADRQVRALKVEYPGVRIVSMAGLYLPARANFWDLVHVYDEVNTDIATRIYGEMGADIR
ncbi:MAG TPA: hypothetical protein VGL82_11215 [Bryobacteraceae bacterium]|jgi:hypothetical protein